MINFALLTSPFMRLKRLFLLSGLIMTIFVSCNKDIELNAEWKEIPVVYCLLNQNDSVHYIKVTKAFLGEGNSLIYAGIPDSNNYPVGDLKVTVEGWEGSVLKQTLVFHDTMVQNKDTGIFYAPTQLVYTTGGQLKQAYTYKLKITNLKKNFDITAQTPLIESFSIDKPMNETMVGFLPDHKTEIKWYPAKGGKRYQVMIRFSYYETFNGITEMKTLDWPIISSLVLDYTTLPVTRSIPGESFYAFLHSRMTPLTGDMSRAPLTCEFIFTVGSPELNTYMEVTEPSNTIVQERPSYTNITNGIGLFASRYDNTKTNRIVCPLNDLTKTELKNNPLTSDLF